MVILLGVLVLVTPGVGPASAADKGPELVVQTGHAAFIRSVALSADGKYVLTLSDDGTAILWDGSNGQQVRTFQGHAGTIGAATLSADGTRVLTGCNDNTAILWDASSGKQLRVFKGHKAWLSSVALSTDGQRVLTGSADWTARLWDASTGQQVKVFEGHNEGCGYVALSGDGKRVLTKAFNDVAYLWDASTGKQLQSFKEGSRAMALSPDGKQVLGMSKDGKAILWDAGTGETLRTFTGRDHSVTALALGANGTLVLTGSSDKKAILWDAGNGKQLQTFRWHGQCFQHVALSSDGKRVLTVSQDNTVILWDAASGQRLQTFKGHTDAIWNVDLSADAKRLLTGSKEVELAILWDALGAQQMRTFKGPGQAGAAMALSADRKRVLTVSADKNAILWDVSNGKQMQTFKGHRDLIGCGALSLDGKRVLTGSNDHTAILWDAASGIPTQTLNGHTDQVSCVAWSANGERVLTGSLDNTAILWDAASGKQLQTFKGHTNYVNSVALSADGSRVLTGSFDKTAILWDAGSGKQLQTFAGDRDIGSVSGISIALSADAKQVLTGATDMTASLWDAATGKQLRTFKGHTGHVNSVALSPDGKRVLTGSADGTIRWWDSGTGEELCRLVSLDHGQDWLVVTPSGLFDGSAGGRQTVMYRIGDGLHVVPVDRFFQDFYRPGLLASVLNGEPIKAPNFASSKPPAVRILSPKEGGIVEQRELTIQTAVLDEGGGIQGPWLFLNGARLRAQAETTKEDNEVKRTFTVSLIEGDNRFEVKAACADGSWESEPATITVRFEKPLAKPVVHIVAIGISKYAEDSYKLKFAAEDATAMAELFRKRGPALYREAKTTTLLDSEATRDKIRATLQRVPKDAQPQDTLILFLAGHGAMVGQRYYFIPHDFRISKDKQIEDDIRQQGLPADELADFLSAGPALKRILILDTCASGGVVDLFKVAGRNPFAFRGEIERLSRSQGLCMLAASAATEEAKEPSELGHGVLTYTLLAGMKAVQGGPLERKWLEPSSKEQVVDVLEWFSYAQGHVRRLTKEYCGQEQNVHMGLRGSSFPVLPLK